LLVSHTTKLRIAPSPASAHQLPPRAFDPTASRSVGAEQCRIVLTYQQSLITSRLSRRIHGRWHRSSRQFEGSPANVKTTKRTKARKRQPGSIDHDLVKAMAHRARYELLMKLDGRTASPMELSKEVNMTVGAVSYHIRQLEEMGFVELVDRKQRRGAIEHFYRATQRAWFEREGWSRLPVAIRRSMAGATLDSISNSIKQAAGANAFDEPSVHVSATALELDDEGYAAVCDALDAVLQQIMDIQAECAARGAAERPTQLVLMHFDRG
jgi:DNA-binding transcriptional ArsR family regulator